MEPAAAAVDASSQLAVGASPIPPLGQNILHALLHPAPPGHALDGLVKPPDGVTALVRLAWQCFPKLDGIGARIGALLDTVVLPMTAEVPGLLCMATWLTMAMRSSGPSRLTPLAVLWPYAPRCSRGATRWRRCSTCPAARR